VDLIKVAIQCFVHSCTI